jgi:hypothetical protein
LSRHCLVGWDALYTPPPKKPAKAAPPCLLVNTRPRIDNTAFPCLSTPFFKYKHCAPHLGAARHLLIVATLDILLPRHIRPAFPLSHYIPACAFLLPWKPIFITHWMVPGCVATGWVFNFSTYLPSPPSSCAWIGGEFKLQHFALFDPLFSIRRAPARYSLRPTLFDTCACVISWRLHCFRPRVVA